MNELESRLRALAVEWPETPELAAAVERRLAASSAPWRPRRLSRRSLAVALAVLAVALVAALAVPGARSALLRFFHLQGVTVEVVDSLPAVRPSTSLGLLGERVSLGEARRRSRFELVEAARLGSPDEVRVGPSGMVSFVYRGPGGVRVILSQFEGQVEPIFLKKVVAGGTRVENVTVGGEPGLFLSGEPHFFMYVSPDGTEHGEPVYLARDVLLWQRGKLTLRLEGQLTLARALELARSIR